MTGWVRQGRIQGWQARIAAPATRAEVARAARRRRAAGPPRRARPWPARCRLTPSPPSRSTMSRPRSASPTGYWRGAAHSYTCFFTESFIDELARAAGLEPLSFRMPMLGDNPRLARCLATAASIGGWDGGAPGSGMGIACHSAFGSHIACLVEVEVTARPARCACCARSARSIAGGSINPGDRQAADRGRAGPRHLRRDRPAARDRRRPADARSRSATYGLPTLRDAPEVSVELLESDEAPGGVTELGVPAAAPAIANAYFSLTGQRLAHAAARDRRPMTARRPSRRSRRRRSACC